MKKTGFTLIELLAVIVVLAIIALIAVPIVLNIIEKTRSGAAISSARSYIKAVETYVLTGELNKKDTLLKNNKYNVTTSTKVGDKTYEPINNLIELKGSKPNGNEDYITIGDTYNVVEAKLTINTYEILIKDAEVVSITKNGKTEEVDNQNPNGESSLSEKVQIGDYVAYDAGVWNESKEKPTSQGEFGGYTKDQSKSDTIDWCYESYYISVLKGWRVLKIENNQVYLVHAGIPECYYQDNDSTTGIDNLNTRANQYLNSAYASSAHMMTYEEALSITGNIDNTDNSLRYIGPSGTTSKSAQYFLASQDSSAKLWHVVSGGAISNNYNGNDNLGGIRPVIVLKLGVKTTGKTTDAVGQEAWNLIAP